MAKLKYLTVKECSDVSGYSLGGVYRWIKSGKVDFIKKGGRFYIESKSFKKQMKACGV